MQSFDASSPRATAPGRAPAAPDEANVPPSFETSAQQALDAALGAVRTLERLHALALRRAMAAELAPGLVPGHPCDVCGSTTHPGPAPFAPDPHETRQALAAGERLVAACRAFAEAVTPPAPGPVRPDSDETAHLRMLH